MGRDKGITRILLLAFLSIILVGIPSLVDNNTAEQQKDYSDYGEDLRPIKRGGSRYGLQAVIGTHLIIDGNDELLGVAEQLELEGSGSQSDPITFRDLTFDYYNESFNPILSNITLHVEFRSCGFAKYIESNEVGERGGISISDSSNIDVVDCRFENTLYMVRMDRCSNVVLKGNIATNDHGGILCRNCSEISIMDNSVLSNGIFLDHTVDTILSGTEVLVDQTRISFDECKRITLEGMRTPYTAPRISITDSEYTILRNNSWMGNPITIKGDASTFSTLMLEGSNRLNDVEIDIISNSDMGGAVYSSHTSQLILSNVSNLLLKDPGGSNMSMMGRVTMGYCENVTFEMGEGVNYNTSFYISHCTGCSVANGISSEVYFFTTINRSRSILVENVSFKRWGYMAIRLEESSGCMIKDCYFKNYYVGIDISRSSGNILENNTFVNSWYVINFNDQRESYSNSLLDNRFFNTSLGIWSLEEYVTLLELENNTLNGREIGILRDIDMKGEVLDHEYGYLILENVRNLVLSDQNMGLGGSLLLINCHRITIIDSLLNQSLLGLQNSTSVTINNCILESHEMGSVLGGGCDDIIIRNSLVKGGNMRFEYCSNVSFKENVFTEGEWGLGSIELSHVEDLSIVEFSLLGMNMGLSLIDARRVMIDRGTIINGEPPMSIQGSRHVTVRNLSIQESNRGIEVLNSQCTRIESCRFEKVYSPIDVRNSTGDHILGNVIHSNGWSTVRIDQWYDSTFGDNTIYPDQGSSSVRMINCVNIDIRGNELHGNPENEYSYGLSIGDGRSILLFGNRLYNYSGKAVALYNITNSQVERNQILGSYLGISMEGASYSNVVKNRFRGCRMCLVLSDYIRGGEYEKTSMNNMIYGNEFLYDDNGSYSPDGFNPAIDNSSWVNHWYSKSQGGNIWQGWTGPDENDDGFVDLPYEIEGVAGATDKAPIAHGDYYENSEDEENSEGWDLGRVIIISVIVLLTIILILYLLLLRLRVDK